MAENGLSERVERIEQKLDRQFAEVQEHFVEQRKYIAFAYDKLDKRMTQGFSRLERKFDQFIDTPSRATSAARRRARPSKRRR
jgi:uncharacterized membrane-anchored protein YhcB (DUF1043 family)